jgi:hypothetical protein
MKFFTGNKPRGDNVTVVDCGVCLVVLRCSSYGILHYLLHWLDLEPQRHQRLSTRLIPIQNTFKVESEDTKAAPQS